MCDCDYHRFHRELETHLSLPQSLLVTVHEYLSLLPLFFQAKRLILPELPDERKVTSIVLGSNKLGILCEQPYEPRKREAHERPRTPPQLKSDEEMQKEYDMMKSGAIDIQEYFHPKMTLFKERQIMKDTPLLFLIDLPNMDFQVWGIDSNSIPIWIDELEVGIRCLETGIALAYSLLSSEYINKNAEKKSNQHDSICIVRNCLATLADEDTHVSCLKVEKKLLASDSSHVIWLDESDQLWLASL